MKSFCVTPLLFILCLNSSLIATTYYVNASKNGSGTSWDDAFEHLQDALAAANSGDQIWVAKGTYYPDTGASQTDNDRTSTFQLKTGVALYGGFLGLASETELADRDHLYHRATLSGDLLGDDDTTGNSSENAYHVLTGSGTDSTAILDGFNIEAGSANGVSPYDSGAALYNFSGSPTLNNCNFDYNTASGNGGAIANDSNSSPTLDNCVFGFNSGNWGAAIYNNSYSSPSLNNCLFGYNSAQAGGAIYNGSNSSPTLDNCSFEGNTAFGAGGAIANKGDVSSTLSNCSFVYNSANILGGAILNDSDSSITLNDCSFIVNSASGGGAIVNDRRSSATLNNCSLTDNSATYLQYTHIVKGGGAISNRSDCFLTLNNCSLASNDSGALGGAIYNAGNMTLTNSSLAGNQASDYGGGIANEASTSTLTNCILWNNKANGFTTTTSASIDNGGSSISSYAHCLIASSGGSANWASAIGTDNGDNVDADPLFIDNTNFEDLRLATNSPALNAGDGTEATSINTTSHDLAYQTRFNGIIDLGAYEGSYTTFANDFSGLNPEDDANGNGLSNYTDYAMGADPTAAPTTHRATTFTSNRVVFSIRVYAADVIPTYQKSTDLVEWSPLVEGIDYNVMSTSSNSTEARVAFLLTPTLLSEPKVFFSHQLSTE